MIFEEKAFCSKFKVRKIWRKDRGVYIPSFLFGFIAVRNSIRIRVRNSKSIRSNGKGGLDPTPFLFRLCVWFNLNGDIMELIILPAFKH
jgi:hypothetical protein